MAVGGGTGGGGGSKGSSGPNKDDLSIVSQMAAMMTQMSVSSKRIADDFENQARASAKLVENMQNVGGGEIVSQLVQVNETLKQVLVALQNLGTTAGATFGALSQGAIVVVGSMNQLADAAEDGADAVDSQMSAMDELKESLAKTGKDALSLKQKMKAVGKYLENEFPVAVGAALGALSGLKQGFNNLISLGSSFFGFAKSIISGFFDIGMSILSIPFKILDGLVNMAKKGGGISEFAQAVNNLRKEFGALGGPVTGAIMKTSKEMAGFNVKGLSAFSVFGSVAERMEKLIALFNAGGVALQGFSKEFEKNGGAILGYQRGLGITDEQMGAIAQTAKATGTTLTKQLNEMTKYATKLGKEFNIDFKIISKGMAKANADMAHFGSYSQKQIGIAVTYFTKLGVEIDKVTGTMDAFATFDEAAEKAATLNQVLHTNIDAMELVNAEGPDETVAILRREFAKAGIDGEKMNKSVRGLVKSMTNLDDAEQKLLFSSKNRGLTLESMKKKGNAIEKTTMSQTEAMTRLADAMERTLKAGETKEGGFLQHFLTGFTDGMQKTEEFRALLANIRTSLRDVYMAGRELGKAFVEYFPGVKDFLGALADVFSPGKFSKLAGGVTNILTQFMKDLGEPGGKASFGDLMTKLKDHFFNFFDQNAGPGSKLLSSFGKIMDAIKVIIAGGVKWLMETVAGFIRDITKFIVDPQSVQGTGNLADAASNYISPISQAFREGWQQLGPAIGELLDKLWENVLKPKFKKFFAKYWPYIAAIVFGPAILQGFVGAGTAALGRAFANILTKAIAGPAATAATQTLTTTITGSLGQSITVATTAAQTTAGPAAAGLFTKLGTKFSSLAAGFSKTVGPQFMAILGPAAIVAGVAMASVDITKAITKFGDKLEKEGFDPATAKIAAGTTGLINTLTLGLLPEGVQESIASSIASLADMLFKSIEKYFGPSSSKVLKGYLSNQFEIFAGLGDLILGIFEGDSAKVDAAFLRIGKGLLNSFMFALQGVFIEMPKMILSLGVYIISGFNQLLSYLLRKAGDIFHALENIPLIGPLFGLIGDLFDKLSEWYAFFGDMFSKFNQFLKSIDISAYFERAKKAVVDFFSGSEVSSNKFTIALKAIVGAIEEPLRLIRKLFNIIFSYDTKKSFLENIKEKWDSIVKAFEESINKFDAFGKIITESIGGAIGWVVEKFEMVKTFFGTLFETITQGPVGNFFKDVIGVFNSIFDFITEWGGKIINAVTLPFRIIGAFIFTVFEAIWDEAISPVLDWIKEKVGIVFDFISNGVSVVWDAIKAAFQKISDFVGWVWDGIKTAVSVVFDFISGIAATIFYVLSWPYRKAYELIKENWDSIIGVIKTVTDFISGIASTVFDTLSWPFKKAYERIKELFVFIWDTISGIVTNLITWGEQVLDKLTEPGVKAKDRLANTFKLIWNIISEIPKKLITWGGELINLILKPFKDAWNWLTENFSFSKFSELGGKILDGIMSGIGSIGDKIEEKFDNAVAGVKDLLGINSPSKEFSDIGENMLDGMLQALGDIVPDGKKIFENFKNAVFAILSPQAFIKIFQDIVDGIKSKLEALADFAPFKAIIEIAKKVFQISSPSKVFQDIGDNISDGLNDGMKDLPANAQKVFDQTVDKAGDFSKQMQAAAPQAQAPGVAAKAANPAGGMADVLANMGAMADAADKAKGLPEKIKDVNASLAPLAAQMNDTAMKLPILTAALQKIAAALTAGGVNVVDTTKQFLELLTGLNNLGELGVKMNKEGIANKIWHLNMAAGSEYEGLGFHLGRVSHHYAPVVAAVAEISTKLFHGVSAADLAKATNDFTAMLNAIHELGNAGVKAKSENIANKIYALNMAAGSENEGLAYHLGRVSHHYAPLATSLAEVSTFVQKNISSPEFTGALTAIKETGSAVTSGLKNSLEPTMQAMSDMVAAVIKIDEAISKTQNIDLSATLQSFKTNFGMALGQKGKHVVQAKDVTINVSFAVMIDATKLEGAILSSNDSRIKEKVNLVVGAIAEMPAKEVGLEKASPTSAFKKIQRTPDGSTEKL